MFYYLNKGQYNHYVLFLLSKIMHQIQYIIKDEVIDFEFIRKIGITYSFKHKILGERYYYNNTSSIRLVKKNKGIKDAYFMELIKIHNAIQYAKFHSEFMNEQNCQSSGK